MYKLIFWRDAGAIFLQDSADPRQIVCDLPMTQWGPTEEADLDAPYKSVNLFNTW